MAFTYFRNTTTQKIITDTNSIARAASLQKKYSTTYFLSTLLFPKKIQAAIAVLYAFVRIPDEMVDNAENEEEARVDILNWQKQWYEYTKQQVQTTEQREHALADYETIDQTKHQGKTSHLETADPKNTPTTNWVMQEMYQLHTTYNIPFDLSNDFIAAMIQDLTVTRYVDYKDLCHYMYGSAAVVGRMITHIVGVHDEAILKEADALGYAMQLTNFLRDIGDDYDMRGRIYLPQDEMAAYGVTEAMIANKQNTPEWQAFMKFQIERNRIFYRQADASIKHLPRFARKAVRAASILYESQLDDIIKKEYNTFHSYKKKAIISKITLLGKQAIISLWQNK